MGNRDREAIFSMHLSHIQAHLTEIPIVQTENLMLQD